MVKSITFSAEDLAFISNLPADPAFVEFAEHLKDVAHDIEPDETVNFEMSDEHIEQLLIAEVELDDKSGVLCHLATIFHHEA
jgi:hypothetical protein|tara:strand:+ start:481 stop:726 length:246 start_codon:yes stop_codon:yes gene_type:complete